MPPTPILGPDFSIFMQIFGNNRPCPKKNSAYALLSHLESATALGVGGWGCECFFGVSACMCAKRILVSQKPKTIRLQN